MANYYAYPKIIRWQGITLPDGQFIYVEGESFGLIIVYETEEKYRERHPDVEPLVLTTIEPESK